MRVDASAPGVPTTNVDYERLGNAAGEDAGASGEASRQERMLRIRTGFNGRRGCWRIGTGLTAGEDADASGQASTAGEDADASGQASRQERMLAHQDRLSSGKKAVVDSFLPQGLSCRRPLLPQASPEYHRPGRSTWR
jgi:hypothetical protein